MKPITRWSAEQAPQLSDPSEFLAFQLANHFDERENAREYLRLLREYPRDRVIEAVRRLTPGEEIADAASQLRWMLDESEEDADG
jgi:hypothetical protein